MADTDTSSDDPPQLSPIAGVAAEVLWTASADGLLLVDGDGRIRASNPSLDALFGYEPGQLVGATIEQLVPGEVRLGHAELRSRYEAAPAARPMAASRLLHGLRADGSTFPINVSLGRLPTAEGPMTVAAVRNLTDRVDAERREADAQRRRSLAEDHDRIASDLHDTVIQRLFALGLDLQGLSGSIDDTTTGRRLATAVDTIDEIIGDIRDTIFGLRHRADEGSGLRERIMAVVAQMEPSLGFAPDLRFVGSIDDMGESPAAANVEPVVREALSNVARHAGADHATVTVSLDDDGLHIEVVDNGQGIPADVARSGLANLADRALALDGRFAVESGVEGGTRLAWSVPYPADPL